MPRSSHEAIAGALSGIFGDTLTSNQRAVLSAAEEGIRRRRQSRANSRYDWFLDGLALLSAAEVLSAGEFGSWRDANTGLSERTAQNYMSAARLLTPDIGPENFSVLHPRIRSTAFLLASPTTPDEVRAIFVPRLIAGEHVPLAVVRDAIAALVSVETDDTTADEPETATGELVDPPPTVVDAEWFDPPTIVALLPAIPCATKNAEDDARCLSPSADAARAQAVAETAGLIWHAMGHDAVCVAALIRGGLGLALADAIDARSNPTGDPFEADSSVDENLEAVAEANSELPSRVTRTRQGLVNLDTFGKFGPAPFGKSSGRRQAH